MFSFLVFRMLTMFARCGKVAFSVALMGKNECNIMADCKVELVLFLFIYFKV